MQTRALPGPILSTAFDCQKHHPPLESGLPAGNRSQGTVPIFAAERILFLEMAVFAAKMGLSPSVQPSLGDGPRDEPDGQ